MTVVNLKEVSSSVISAYEVKRFFKSVYDKLNSFSFSIVRMTHLYRSIPSKTFYSAFAPEIFRIALELRVHLMN